MALFHFGKSYAAPKAVKADIREIKVLGGGCAKCHTLLENTRKAAGSLGLGVEVEYVTDMNKVMSYGILQLPLLVVNGKVVSRGRVLTAREAEDLLCGLEN